ncbi:MAG: DNA-3-methyladenine glycosylase 2 family protein [Chloroflexi bacterium]|nr:MAG: DNA-3-methyladenine glycosylase 2 family protein [Chloroflexota bacterium]
MKFTLPAHRPFNFLSVVNSHGWRQLAPFSYEEDAYTLAYILRLSNGRVVELKLRDGVEGVLVETEKLAKTERKEVAEKVTWMFGLDMDFSLFYIASRLEPKLASVKKRALGRVLRSPTLFEDVIKTILTTNTLWGATKNMTLKLVNELGEPLQDDTTKKAFPTPEAIAASSPGSLKEKIRVGYRASAIHELAVRVASGQFDLEALKTSELSTLELRKELLTINGVGPYAAANLLLILGRSDFIPIDSWALKLVSYEWYSGEPITAREVEKRFEKWGEFKGLAFWFWDWKYNE